MIELLKLAGKIALPINETDMRNFWLGAIGVRKDGVIVSSKNGAVQSSNIGYKAVPQSHAESRLCRKLGKNGIIYVSRVSRQTYELAMARPCFNCQKIIRAHNVKKVYYSINKNQYGVWFPEIDFDKVYYK